MNFGMSKVRMTLALVITVACSSSPDLTSPVGIEAELPGTWAQSFSVPGASTVLHLVVNRTEVTGDGTWAMEAGPSGTLTVAGLIAAPDVMITFTRSDGLVGHFNARLESADVLKGSLWFSSDPVVAEFRRTSR